MRTKFFHTFPQIIFRQFSSLLSFCHFAAVYLALLPHSPRSSLSPLSLSLSPLVLALFSQLAVALAGVKGKQIECMGRSDSFASFGNVQYSSPSPASGEIFILIAFPFWPLALLHINAQQLHFLQRVKQA